MGLVNLLLLEKIPLAGIARATGVSDSWLQDYVNACYAAVPKTAAVLPKAKGKLKVQMDELWSFVDYKGNQQWVWLAMDTDTREIVSVQYGCSFMSTTAQSERRWQKEEILFFPLSFTKMHYPKMNSTGDTLRVKLLRRKGR